MKRSKGYRTADKTIDRERLYTPVEAVRMAKQTTTTKFDATVEVALRLGVDPRKADQMVPSSPAAPRPTRRARRAPTSSGPTT